MKFFNGQSNKVKIVLIVLLLVFICCCGINSMAIVGSFLPSTPTKETVSTPLIIQEDTNLPEPTLEPTKIVKPVAEPTSNISRGQSNAIDKAKSYLAYTSFSRSGLINQLVFEKFSVEDATFAVDSLNVDWTEQAYLKAKSYLDYTSFSLEGLITQLEFEGFTIEESTGGATRAYSE